MGKQANIGASERTFRDITFSPPNIGIWRALGWHLTHWVRRVAISSWNTGKTKLSPWALFHQPGENSHDIGSAVVKYRTTYVMWISSRLELERQNPSRRDVQTPREAGAKTLERRNDVGEINGWKLKVLDPRWWVFFEGRAQSWGGKWGNGSISARIAAQITFLLRGQEKWVSTGNYTCRAETSFSSCLAASQVKKSDSSAV